MIDDINRFEVRRRWPRVIRMVEEYVGNRSLAARYLAKAVQGEALYVEIVFQAFARRHQKRRRKVCAL